MSLSPFARVDVCKTCNAPIVWAFTVTGKAMPLDAKADPKGHFTVTRDNGGKLWALPAAPSDERARDRFTSHFSTCKDADAHRRPRSKRPSKP